MIDITEKLLPLIGVALGWILSQLTDKLKSNREDKKKLKKTLFYLLEARHHLNIYVSGEEFVAISISVLKKKLGISSTTDELEIKQFMNQIIPALVKEKPLSNLHEIENIGINFSKCIDNLSEVDPVLAFRLQGKQSVKPSLSEFLSNLQLAITEVSNNISDVEQANTVIKIIEPKLLKESLRDLDEILIEVAKKINRRTVKQTKKRITSHLDSSTRSEIEETFEKIIEGLPGVSMSTQSSN